MNYKEAQVYVGDGAPLNSNSCFYLNLGNPQRISQHGIYCEVTPERVNGRNVLKVNTSTNGKTSRKFKCLYGLNICISLVGLAISCSFSLFWWNEVDLIKKEILNLKNQRIEVPIASTLQSRHLYKDSKTNSEDNTNRPVRPFISNKFLTETPTTEEDKKILEQNNLFSKALPRTGLLVAHFSGAANEVNLGLKLEIGPWYLDTQESSIDSDNALKLNGDSTTDYYVIVKEEGLYFVYAQVCYLTNAPSTFHMWARQRGESPRRLASCSTGDATRGDRGLVQLSCSTHTAARLFAGDTVSLSQREQNRTVWLEAGRSYFGFVKLSS